MFVKPAHTEVVVAISSVPEANITLQPKLAAAEVIVKPAPPSITTEPLDKASTVYQTVIYRQDLETIPFRMLTRPRWLLHREGATMLGTAGYFYHYGRYHWWLFDGAHFCGAGTPTHEAVQ
jgi:hypothetical protein